MAKEEEEEYVEIVVKLRLRKEENQFFLHEEIARAEAPGGERVRFISTGKSYGLEVSGEKDEWTTYLLSVGHLVKRLYDAIKEVE